MSNFWKILPATLFLTLPFFFFFFSIYIWTQTLFPVTPHEPVAAAEGALRAAGGPWGSSSPWPKPFLTLPDTSQFLACPASATQLRLHSVGQTTCLLKNSKAENSGMKTILINFRNHTYISRSCIVRTTHSNTIHMEKSGQLWIN